MGAGNWPFAITSPAPSTELTFNKHRTGERMEIHSSFLRECPPSVRRCLVLMCPPLGVKKEHSSPTLTFELPRLQLSHISITVPQSPTSQDQDSSPFLKCWVPTPLEPPARVAKSPGLKLDTHSFNPEPCHSPIERPWAYGFISVSLNFLIRAPVRIKVDHLYGAGFLDLGTSDILSWVILC